MSIRSIRSFNAFLLLVAISVTFVAPSSVFAQKQTPVVKTDDQDSKKKAEKTQLDSKRPLAVNEDPALIGKRNINKGFTGWLGGSQDKEIGLGRALAIEVDQQTKFVDDPVITEYVNRVGQNIVLHSDAKVPFTIKVVDSDEVNAFALPGGFFYVNKGLILAADNESELAGVMAHEIAHVAARHAVENQGKQTLLGYGILAGIIFSGGIAGTVLQNTNGIIQGLVGLKFTRDSETEADRLGVQYLYAAGYDPNGLSTMFEKLAAQNKKKAGNLTKLFSTHPQSIDRRDASLALVARFPERDEYVISSSEFQRVKARLLRLSNAKASTIADINEGDGGKPTLKKRAPEPDENATPDGASDSSSSSDKKAPVLKKRPEVPEPTPTPEQ